MLLFLSYLGKTNWGGGGNFTPNQIRIKALSNIYDGAFMQKWLTNFSRYLFSQESFIGDVDVSKGSQRHLGKFALHLHVRNTHSNISGEKAAIFFIIIIHLIWCFKESC